MLLFLSDGSSGEVHFQMWIWLEISYSNIQTAPSINIFLYKKSNLNRFPPFLGSSSLEDHCLTKIFSTHLFVQTSNALFPAAARINYCLFCFITIARLGKKKSGNGFANLDCISLFFWNFCDSTDDLWMKILYEVLISLLRFYEIVIVEDCKSVFINMRLTAEWLGTSLATITDDWSMISDHILCGRSSQVKSGFMACH